MQIMEDRPAGRPDPNTPPDTGPRIAVPWGVPEIRWGVAGLAVVAFAAGGLFLLLSLLSAGEGTPTWIFVTTTLTLEVGMITVAWRMGPYHSRSPANVLLGVRRLPTAPLFAWGAVAFMISVVASAVYVSFASRLWGALEPPPLADQIDIGDLRMLTFLTVVLVAPMAEETFFRGFLFAGLLQRLGLWRAAGISGALFAISHVDIALIGPAFLAGLAFAWVYWRTGSVWPAVLAHTAQNAIAFGLAV